MHLAIALHASSAHFLTDMFSSGHVRVPRRELAKALTFPAFLASSVGGLFTLAMHNEDGELGVTVTNENGKVWVAYGDETLYSTKSRDNLDQVSRAVEIGMAEVIGTIKKSLGNTAENFPKPGEVYKLLPKDATQSNTSNLPKNATYPLFRVIKDKVGKQILQRRKDVNNPKCNEFVSNWWAFTTLALLTPQIIKYVAPGVYKFFGGKIETKPAIKEVFENPKSTNNISPNPGMKKMYETLKKDEFKDEHVENSKIKVPVVIKKLDNANSDLQNEGIQSPISNRC